MRMKNQLRAAEQRDGLPVCLILHHGIPDLRSPAAVGTGLDAGNRALAEESYTRGITQDPSFTVLYLLRAEMRRKLGDVTSCPYAMLRDAQQK